MNRPKAIIEELLADEMPDDINPEQLGDELDTTTDELDMSTEELIIELFNTEISNFAEMLEEENPVDALLNKSKELVGELVGLPREDLVTRYNEIAGDNTSDLGLGGDNGVSASEYVDSMVDDDDDLPS